MQQVVAQKDITEKLRQHVAELANYEITDMYRTFNEHEQNNFI